MPATKHKVINCAVCGMELGKDPAHKANYKEQTFYFCSDSDEKEFEKRPHVYAGYAGILAHMSKKGKAA
jgi:YHS domain-containing protein